MTEIIYNNKSIIAFSDTHGKHRKLSSLPVDIAVFLGDACDYGNNVQFQDFLDWFSQYPSKYKLFIAGNHELQWLYQPNEFLATFPKNIIFLENRIIRLEGITFVSVVALIEMIKTPILKIPEKVDFLLTHAPPKGILDDDFGCSKLLKYVLNIQPNYHLFGHVHQFGNRTFLLDNIIFSNVSVYNEIA